MQFLFSLPKRSIIGRISALNCCMTSLLAFFFGGLYMLPKVMSCWRCSCWTLMKSPSHKSDAIIKSLKLYEYSSSNYVINPPWALQDFPLCIDLYPGISYCDVSLLSDSHVSCRHMALKWISFSFKYDRKPRKESNLAPILWILRLNTENVASVFCGIIMVQINGFHWVYCNIAWIIGIDTEVWFAFRFIVSGVIWVGFPGNIPGIIETESAFDWVFKRSKNLI